MTEVSVSPSEPTNNAAATGDSAAPVQRPDNVPEKFWDPATGQVNTDALLQSYAHLENKQGATVSTGDVGDGELSIPTAPKQTAEDVLTSVVKSYTESGSFSEADLGAMAAAGLTKNMVQTHITGQAAIAGARVQSAYAAAGDKAQYEAMTSWAGANLPKAEVQAFDGIVNGGDPNAVALAVGGLKAKYTAANGAEGFRTEGAVTQPTGEVYSSRADFVAATKTPLYKTSQTERDRVRDIVERSMGNWS